jgi:hypothetical protein
MIASKDQLGTIAAVAAGSVEQELNPFPPALSRLDAAFVIATPPFLQRGDGRGTVTSIDCRGGQNSSASGMPSREKSGSVALRGSG